jgi:tight adherence protein C
MFSGFGMSTFGLTAGLVCAAAIFLFFSQLDRAAVAAQELPPTDELRALSRKRRGLAYQLDRLGRRFGRGLPDDRRQAIQAQLNVAGRPWGLTPTGFQAARVASASLLTVVGMIAGLILVSAAAAIAFGAIGAAGGYYLPSLVIGQLAGARRREIHRNLPDAVDLLTLAVEAGLSLDAGMADITVRFHNALGDEFAKVLREVRLGRPRLVALEDMGRRCGVAELHNVVQAITQSEQMGIPIARTLRVQASELRRQRRQNSQEAAARASLRMIFPMVGCIFPTIWIILLGPALLGVVKAWH